MYLAPLLYKPLPRTLEAALRDARDRKVDVRASAVNDLVPHAETAREAVLKELERALDDEHPAVRGAAAEALGDLEGREALSGLLVAVEDDDQLVRQQAIMALGLIRDPRAQQKLERSLTDARPEVRYQAVMAYPRVVAEKASAVTALAAATKDADESVAHIAFRMAEELAEELGAPIAPAIVARAEACVEKAPVRVRVVAALLLFQAEAKPAARERAERIVVDVVTGKLVTPELEDVSAAIEIAGEHKLQGAVPALERRAFGGMLGFGRDAFQYHARIALARLGNDRAKKIILDELGAANVEKRTMAVAAAGRARLQEARSLLLSMQGKPHRAEPSEVEAALARIGDA